MKRAREDVLRHPFPTVYTDHFETSLQAYSDILIPLDSLCKKLGKTRENLNIYDPYFCTGMTNSKLRSLGFNNVYNKNIDCYKEWEEKSYPPFDVVITNPPYSEDHKIRSLKWCLESGACFFWLVPNYTILKKWYKETTASTKGLFYAVPTATYTYDHPEGTGHLSAPFSSIWVCHGGTLAPSLLGQWKHALQGKKPCSITLAETAHAAGITEVKRANPRQRMAAKKRAGFAK